MYAQTKTRSLGLTLVELIVTMAVSALLITMGTSVSSRWYQRQILFNEESRLIGLLRFARHQSYMTGHTVMICPRSAISTEGNCTQGVNWAQDLIVVDLNPEGKQQVLREYPAVRRGVQLSFVSFQQGKGARFNYQALHAASSGHFKIELGQYQYRVLLNRIGRIRSVFEVNT